MLHRPVQPTDHNKLEEDSRVRNQGTPNGVRMFPVKRGSSSSQSQELWQPTDHNKLEEDSRVRDQGTPNGVRVFPVKRGSSSESIPIPIPIVKKQTPAELQLLEEEALAEFREYRMYHRIVSGMNTKAAASNPRKEQEINGVRMFPVKRGSSSESIPIPIPIVKKQTPAELQLLEEEALAEFREYRMYHRIVSGMNTKAAASNPRKEQELWQHSLAAESLENIIMAGNSRLIPENRPTHLGIATQQGIPCMYASRLQQNIYAADPPFHLMMPVTAEAFNPDGFPQGVEEGIFELEL
jgi:hypothetical protein